MYQGKHTKRAVNGSTPRRKRRLRWRKEFVLLCSAVVLRIGLGGGSLAYLFTNTDPVRNTFTPAAVDVEIIENFNEQEKKDVSFKNKGDVPVYMRARLVINWTDSERNIVPAPASDYEVKTSDLALPESGWVKNGNYYYYTSPVPAGGTTSNLVNSITATTPDNPEYFLLVDVLVETIQADGVGSDDKRPVESAWGVTVGTDGTLNVSGS